MDGEEEFTMLKTAPKKGNTPEACAQAQKHKAPPIGTPARLKSV